MSAVKCPFDGTTNRAEFTAWHDGWQAGAKAVNEIWNRQLDAQGIETRSATDPKGRGPEGESPVAESDAPNTNPRNPVK